ncbi:MAG: helix-turn-helix transcriptional regulator [Opitutaceae bacterium]|nr:helix-turn-helix transcriptional regulator [Opitutaceae bacterium]
MPQEDVASECGWPQSVIAKIEQGKRRLNLVEFKWGEWRSAVHGRDARLRKPTGETPVLRQSGGFAVSGRGARATRNWRLGTSRF